MAILFSVLICIGIVLFVFAVMSGNDNGYDTDDKS